MFELTVLFEQSIMSVFQVSSWWFEVLLKNFYCCRQFAQRFLHMLRCFSAFRLYRKLIWAAIDFLTVKTSLVIYPLISLINVIFKPADPSHKIWRHCRLVIPQFCVIFRDYCVKIPAVQQFLVPTTMPYHICHIDKSFAILLFDGNIRGSSWSSCASVTSFWFG